MSPPRSLGYSPKYLCVPIELKDPFQFTQMEVSPKKRFEDIPPPPLPWVFIKMKILLMTVCALSIWLETCRIADSSRIQLVQAVLIVYELTFMMPIVGVLIVFHDVDKYTKQILAYILISYIRTLSTVGLLIYSVFDGKAAYVYSIASLCSISLEIAWMIDEEIYSMKWPEKNEQELIEELKNTFRSEHKLGDPFLEHFHLEPTVSRELVWPGTPQDSEDYTLPMALYSQSKEGQTEYYVSWSSFYIVLSRINYQISKIEDLAKKNKKLREDLILQSQLIVKLKEKIYGCDVDTIEARKLPAGNMRGERLTVVVDAMFVLIGEKLEGFVKLEYFRKMVDALRTFNVCFDLLDTETFELKKGLQHRKEMNNSLIVAVLRMRFQNGNNIDYGSINDVD